MKTGTTIGERIKAARKAARLTQAAMAGKLGIDQSTLAHYERDQNRPSEERYDAIARLCGVGTEWLQYGRGEKPKSVTIDQLRDKVAKIRPRGLQEAAPAASIATVLELDVRASMGGGALIEDEQVVQEWKLPAAMLQAQTSAPIEGIRIITAYGDSMEPGIPPGSKLLVDTGDRVPSPPGVFAVFDGLATVVKRVELVPHSEPPTVRLTSDNTHYTPYERTLDEAHILGRVIGRWLWM